MVRFVMSSILSDFSSSSVEKNVSKSFLEILDR